MARRLKVLIVEDDPDSAETLRMLLELQGHDARSVTTADEALPLARSFQPEIAFLDIVMPGVTGLDIAKHLRAEFGGRIQIVAISGMADQRTREDSASAGFDAFIAKPADLGLVEAILAQLSGASPPPGR